MGLELSISGLSIPRAGGAVVTVAPIWSAVFSSFALASSGNAAANTAAASAKNLSHTRASDGAITSSATTAEITTGGNNTIRIEDRGQGRGINLAALRTNLFFPYDGVEGVWAPAAGATVTDQLAIVRPNGTTGVTGKIDFGTCAVGTGANRSINSLTPGAPYLSEIFVRAVSGTSKVAFEDPQGNGQRAIIAYATTAWQRLSAVRPLGGSIAGLAFNKIDAESTPIYIWGAGIYATPYDLDTVPTPYNGSGIVTHAGERLWHTAPGTDIIRSGRVSLEYTLLPSGREDSITGRLWTSSAGDYAQMTAGVLSVSVGGTVVTFPTAATWPAGETGDLLRIFVAAGGGLPTIAYVKTRYGVVSLGTGASLGTIAATTLDLLCNGTATQFGAVCERMDAYNSGEAPAWIYGSLVSWDYVDRDWNHIIIQGQSLALGNNGGAATSTAQPYANLMFNGGLQPGGSGAGVGTIAGVVSITALVEGIIAETSASGETHGSGMANLVTQRVRGGSVPGLADHIMLVSACAKGGSDYATIARRAGSVAAKNMYYADYVAQMRAAKALADAAGKLYAARAFTFTHGESDDLGGTTATDYQADVQKLQRDMEDDGRAISGQSEPIYMIASQDAAWTSYASRATPLSAIGLYLASKATNKVLLACPKYMMPTVDGTHITAAMSTWLGEFYAKVYETVVLLNQTWKPLQPLTVTKSGGTITAVFEGNVGSLQFDTVTVTDPGNKGFELDSGTITGVTITASNTVQITFTGTPTRLRYAYTGTIGNNAGPTNGARGCLKDTDPMVSRTGRSLANWCVVFDEAIN